ncbi:septal ring lytic transglycosylase RlpA family protein [Vreelandella populi]|uniref:Endolytic peptidoglycan transglycosylase RlpA n=1 Tax=Vreelandella populi TaxID=2498858 RepID=A0A3S0Z175_9GAMM|nr:septal ring lytic transglycosylase RlpA family protein [Halomonas populi]RUR40781.1 septal ring lytic transglycosylase RlpA family protein [Halomonas populi]RUR49288.1 septal ring lytic transglycosylase RlpA family protein [Halomonas populi]RUR55777.1 septal ring lytic transglycosylase RlpA family protein [Halomonas populi]
MKMLQRMTWRVGSAIALVALISGCASRETQRVDTPSQAKPAASTASSGAGTSGGRYAMNGDAYPVEPPDVSRVPDAEPRIEPHSRAGNRPTYEVWGKTYHVMPDASGYAKQGTASWYGEKFHGYATSNGEIYDMYKMSAAHRSLPLPTFARVTSLDSGQSVIVRVNDRGPFHSDREIDLSYAAAARLGILDNGTGRVKVEAVDPALWLAERGRPARAASAAVSTPAASSAPGEQARRVPAPQAAPVQPASSPASPLGNEAEGAIYLQIAALGSAEGAQQLQQRLENELPHGVRVMSDANVHRVQVGPVGPAQETRAREELRQAGFPQAFIVR